MSLQRKVVLVGIGGASCSGKTLLAKHIRSVIPTGATILHQDDFAPPIDQVPYSPSYPDLQDWDDPPTCILWSEFRDTLKTIKHDGTLPSQHQSHDHLNKQVEVDVDQDVLDRARDGFKRMEEDQKAKGFELVWIIVDGFVLYWDKEVVDTLDVKLFLRVPRELLKTRRETRQTYVLQNPDDAAAGGVWTDPPNYFEQIVYPAYIKAHEQIFENGDIDNGGLKPERKGLHVLQPLEGRGEMTKCFEESCEAIQKVLS